MLGWVGRGDVCTMWVHVWWVWEVNIGGKIDGGRNMHVQYMYYLYAGIAMYMYCEYIYSEFIRECI